MESSAHIGLGGLTYLHAENFVRRAAGPAPIELDGEDHGGALVAFSVLPRALRVIVPKSNRGDSHA